jgi:hypothetical protein
MYKFIGLSNFAEWFFAESLATQAENFRRFRDVFINPYIDDILAHANSNPAFATPAQKIQLQNLKTDDELFNALPTYVKKRFDQEELRDDEKVRQNIAREKAKNDPNAFANLDELIQNASEAKLRKGSAKLGLTNIIQFINHVVTMKAKYATAQAEREFLTGGALGGEEGASSAPDVEVDDQEIRDRAEEKADITEKTNKIYQCVRFFIEKKAARQANRLLGSQNEINSQLSNESEVLDLALLTDVKTLSILNLAANFIKSKEKTIDADGIPHVKNMFPDRDLMELLSSKTKYLKKIVDNENFKPWVLRQLQKDDPVAKALMKSTLGIAFIYALHNKQEKGGSLKDVSNVFNTIASVSADETLGSFLNAIKEKFIEGKVRFIRNSKLGSMINTEVSGGGDDAIKNYMFDHKFPNPTKGESDATDFFNFLTQIKGNRDIVWEDSCEEILAALGGSK